ncbi:MAG: hypothetical protein Q4C01_01355 [Clostridia bacterium]|nr:hypothetical protein [Clostridia bacterium]
MSKGMKILAIFGMAFVGSLLMTLLRPGAVFTVIIFAPLMFASRAILKIPPKVPSKFSSANGKPVLKSRKSEDVETYKDELSKWLLGFSNQDFLKYRKYLMKKDKSNALSSDEQIDQKVVQEIYKENQDEYDNILRRQKSRTIIIVVAVVLAYIAMFLVIKSIVD